MFIKTNIGTHPLYNYESIRDWSLITGVGGGGETGGGHARCPHFNVERVTRQCSVF